MTLKSSFWMLGAALFSQGVAALANAEAAGGPLAIRSIAEVESTRVEAGHKVVS